MNMNIFMYVCAPHACLVFMEARRGCYIPWNCSCNTCDPPCEWWDPKLGPLQAAGALNRWAISSAVYSEVPKLCYSLFALFLEVSKKNRRPRSLKVFYYLCFVCMFVGVHVEARGQLERVSFPFHYVGPRDQTEVVRLGSRCWFSYLGILFIKNVGI